MAQDKIKSSDVNSKTGTGDTFVFSTSPQISQIELGDATDTTLARVSAGVASIEGARVITSTGTTSGTILKNNGTTFVASTETYAAPSTSGNVMTSDGTNWTSAAPAGGGGSPRQLYTFHTSDSFTSGAKFSQSVIGSGNLSIALGGYHLNTGGTDGSLYALNGWWVSGETPVGNFFNWSPELQTQLKFTNTTASDFNSFIILGPSRPTQGTTTLTAKHMGFILRGTTLYATNGSGSAQTTTDVSSGITLTGHHSLRCVQNGSTDIKFYINGVLVATHTTNLPSGTFSNPGMVVGIQNDVGVTQGRQMTFTGANVYWNAVA
jgi:hypothetical protein